MQHIKNGGWIALCCLLLSACTGPAAFERPNGVALAPNGLLYVMDFGHYRIAQVDESGRLVKSIGKFGPGTDQIYFGWDMAVDPQGNAYFGNVIRDDDGVRHDGIKIFSSEGKFLREVGGQDYPPHNEGKANLPYGLDVDEQGRVYTADYETNRVRVFNPDGQLILQLPGDGHEAFSFTNPGDVAVDDNRGFLYVTDFTMGQLLKFELAFEDAGSARVSFLQAIGSYGREPGQFAFPQNLAIDESTGTVYVGDLANRRVQAFDVHGKYLASYAPEGVTDWQVLGLAAGSHGTIYAGDALNNTVWMFFTDGQPARRVEAQP